ncbi:MAG: FkbM family methyltransferase [Clostridia bacterium]|nr:FkbM family methyltransferase [Clostridia bacterium]
MFSLKETEDLWTRLRRESRPILLYGTGDGADKLFRALDYYGISVSDIFVSDEFYRNQTFRGYQCRTYGEIRERYPDAVILLAFAVFRKDMLRWIREIGEDYELLVPDLPVFGDDWYSMERYLREEKEIGETLELLADDRSRSVFSDLIHYRISGKPSYLQHCESPREEIFSDLFALSKEEDYVDLGAFRGDTISEFLEQTGGSFHSILALEPDEKNFRKLQEYVGELGLSEEQKESVCLLPYASWSGSGIHSFDGGGGRSSALGEGKWTVETRSVDSLLSGRQVTYLKMDVEGAERETLAGLSETLRTWKPKLAVSAYHRTEDLLLLPRLIRSGNPDYCIHLRHHPYYPAWETNYYAL